MQRIAVDAMGGDDAPAVVVRGAVQAVSESDVPLHVLLVGREQELEQSLADCNAPDDGSISIVDAPQVIGMAESPAAAVKSKRRSSIHVGLAAHREGKADAFVSAGNTGAVMAASLFILKRLPGISRPSVLGFYPTIENFCVVLDMGTNVDCKPEHLLQFARMGSIYAERTLGRENPSVALMNIGEEPSKGNEQVRAAYELLTEEEEINFRGNIEGRDLMKHAADVIICDGFVGNVMLKLGESIMSVLSLLVGQEMEGQQLSEKEKGIVMRVMQGVQKPFNYEEFGGLPLLGVNGNVLIGHGSSSVKAVTGMILSAASYAEKNVAQSIRQAFAA